MKKNLVAKIIVGHIFIWLLSTSAFANVTSPIKSVGRHPQSQNQYLIQKKDLQNFASKDPEAYSGIYDNVTAAPIEQFIRSASKTVDIEIYEMKDLDVLAAIKDAMARGVVVRIIKEPSPVGVRCRWWDSSLDDSELTSDCKVTTQLYKDVNKGPKGSKMVAFDKELCGRTKKTKNCYQHGKMILIDRADPKLAAALISTGNFNSSNLCNLRQEPSKCNRDFSYITTEPDVIEALAKIFENDFASKRTDFDKLLGQNDLAKKITVSPYAFEPLVEFLSRATGKIQIQTQYLKDNEFNASIIKLKQKKPNLDIEIQLADTCNYGSISEHDAYNYSLLFRKFDDLGIKIKMFNKHHRLQGKPGYLHSKIMIVDQSLAWLGSTNVSETSFQHNREFGIFFDNQGRVSSLSQLLEEDFNNKTNSEWKKSVLDCPRKASKRKSNKVEEDLGSSDE